MLVEGALGLGLALVGYAHLDEIKATVSDFVADSQNRLTDSFRRISRSSDLHISELMSSGAVAFPGCMSREKDESRPEGSGENPFTAEAEDALAKEYLAARAQRYSRSAAEPVELRNLGGQQNACL